MDVLFLDTNVIRNQGGESFFGNKETFQTISSHAQIIIPSIVIDEIKAQKRRNLLSQLERFRKNYFTQKLRIFNGPLFLDLIEDVIEHLYSNCQDEISHTELEVDLKDRLLDMRKKAVSNLAPFEEQNDKGFKDAYIFFTILEYQTENPNDEIFVMTNDGRLKEALDFDKEIKVISDVEEYYDYWEGYFSEDYFIGRLREELEIDDSVLIEIMDANINEDDDWDISVTINGAKHRIIADFYSREIINNDY